MLENYIFLFVDSLFSSMILPLRSEMVYPAMVITENFNKYLITLIAILASITGLLINYLIGKYLNIIKKSKVFETNQEELGKCQNFWNKYIIWLLPLMVFSSIGNVTSLFCGFFNTKFIYFLALITIGKVVYYTIFNG